MGEMGVAARQERADRLWMLVLARYPDLDVLGRVEEFHALAAAVRREQCPDGLRALDLIERSVTVPGFAPWWGGDGGGRA
jgi:hypothetical protein